MREPVEVRRERRRKKHRAISFIRTLLEITLLLVIIFGYNHYNGTIDKQSGIIAKVQQELNKTREQSNELLAATSMNDNGTVPTLEQAVKNTKQMKAQLKVLKERKELYDKYEYVLFYNGQRTDMTYGMVKHGEDVMKSQKCDPNLLFGLIMVESKATEKAQNKSSSARGFCQIIASTGKSIYERYLNKGTYNHNMAFDGYTNIDIGAKLIATNMEKYNGDTYSVIQRYRGIPEIGTYYSAVDGYVNRGGTSLREIARKYPYQ